MLASLNKSAVVASTGRKNELVLKAQTRVPELALQAMVQVSCLLSAIGSTSSALCFTARLTSASILLTIPVLVALGFLLGFPFLRVVLGSHAARMLLTLLLLRQQQHQQQQHLQREE